jgi:membrane protease YdiL (CAAX protease family)
MRRAIHIEPSGAKLRPLGPGTAFALSSRVPRSGRTGGESDDSTREADLARASRGSDECVSDGLLVRVPPLGPATEATDSSLIHAPAIDWPTIAGCLGLDALGLLGLPGVHLHGVWTYLWWTLLFGASGSCLARARGFGRRALGLVWHAEPSVGFWLRASAWMAGAIAVGLAAAVVSSRAGADPFGLCRAAPLGAYDLYDAVIRAPVVEEVAFRLLLCGALVGRLSSAANVAVNGALFALVHVVFGGIGPDSAVGGFFLAWAFLRSGTIVVPVLLHSVGNAALVALTGSGALAALACGTG